MKGNLTHMLRFYQRRRNWENSVNCHGSGQQR